MSIAKKAASSRRPNRMAGGIHPLPKRRGLIKKTRRRATAAQYRTAQRGPTTTSTLYLLNCVQRKKLYLLDGRNMKVNIVFPRLV